MATGLPGGTSFMEDYTYHLGPGEPKILGAHMLEVCPSIADGRRAARSTRWASATARTRSGWCSTPSRGRRSSSASPTWVTGSVWWPTRSTSCRPTSRCPSCRSLARCGSRGPTFATSTEAWLLAGGPHHTVLSSAVGARERWRTSPTWPRTELLVIDGDTTMRSFRNEVRWNQAYYRLARGF